MYGDVECHILKITEGYENIFHEYCPYLQWLQRPGPPARHSSLIIYLFLHFFFYKQRRALQAHAWNGNRRCDYQTFVKEMFLMQDNENCFYRNTHLVPPGAGGASSLSTSSNGIIGTFASEHIILENQELFKIIFCLRKDRGIICNDSP